MSRPRDRTRRAIMLSQAKYIEDVLARFGMESAHAVRSPMDPGVRLVAASAAAGEDAQAAMQGIPYQSAVGSIMYAMLGTRPDLAFARADVPNQASCFCRMRRAA